MTTAKLLLTLLAISATSLAMANLAGTVVRVNGTADAVHASGKSRVLSAGSEVNVGDTVITTKDSAIQVQMKDGALLAISRASALKIDAYYFEDPSGAVDKIKLNLKYGRFRTITGDAAKDSYALSTPNALVKINGTVYDVLVEEGGTHKTLVVLRDGSIMVSTQCDSGVVEDNTMLLNSPGMAAAIEALCQKVKAGEDVDVPDLDAALPVTTAAPATVPALIPVDPDGGPNIEVTPVSP